ncbi:hypothetical protein [Actinomadura sp. K4S16]|uniref:hypothetical protein n=1 Tax=Actinomadura sp. K4S16 TaxID=1316147 RepID=UPI0011EEB4F7|nr:hypothetical protein [Actinomadura sp. K4S16]
MAHTLKDLTEVMEAASAPGRPSPDLLADVRRRVGRGNRARAAAGALGVALVAGGTFGTVQALAGNDSGPAPRRQEALGPAMTGVTNGAFPDSARVEGLRPVAEVHYSEFGRTARLTFTPTGEFTMVRAADCGDATVFGLSHDTLSSYRCGGEAYMLTTPGVPVTIETTVLSRGAARDVGNMPTLPALNRYLAAHKPTPGHWSVQVYSGPCTSDTCKTRHPPKP